MPHIAIFYVFGNLCKCNKKKRAKESALWNPVINSNVFQQLFFSQKEHSIDCAVSRCNFQIRVHTHFQASNYLQSSWCCPWKMRLHKKKKKNEFVSSRTLVRVPCYKQDSDEDNKFQKYRIQHSSSCNSVHTPPHAESYLRHLRT